MSDRVGDFERLLGRRALLGKAGSMALGAIGLESLLANRVHTQGGVPELTDLSQEPDEVFDLYGPDSRRPGTYASNCLLARRMLERGARFVQLFHPDWDHHSRLTSWCRARYRDTDQPSAALIQDLQRRGLLDDTLVVWGGEFGRSVAGQGDWGSPG